MLNPTFIDKYSPKTIRDLPFDKTFNSIIEGLVEMNFIKTILVSNNYYSKNIIINTIIKGLNVSTDDIMYVSQFKDQGVSNIRYEVKLFSQIPRARKRILVIEDIETLTENIQKLFINNIDKWSNNLNVIVTCNNIFNVDEALASRLLPITIPNITSDTISTIMDKIITEEQINIDDQIKKILLSLSENNILSMFHMLQKCSLLQSSYTLTEKIIRNTCTMINNDTFKKYIDLVKNKDYQAGYKYLLSIINNGHSVIDILNELYLYVKICSNLKENEKYECFKIISKYIVTFITIHEEELELLIFSQELTEIF